MSAVNRVPLESSGRHSVLCRREPSGEWLLELCHSDADRRSAAHRGLFQHLRVHAGEREWAFEPRTDRVVLPPDVGRLQIRLGGAGAVPVADLEVRGDGLHELARHPLSPLELRYLAEVGFPHPQPADPPPGTAGTGTDLHTHFAGCVRPEDLLRLGLDAGVDYCLAALREAGIQWEGAGTVPLAQLSPEVTTRLLTRWAVPPDRQIPFRGLERIYQLRRPLTKHPRLFLPLLRQIAADYQAMGVRYAELSLSDVLKTERLLPLHTALPDLEQEYGVRLRFLAAFSRHDDLEWDLDALDRLADLADSRMLVGLDFMGHETNSTHAFREVLLRAARWADQARPGFTLRVHAGENPAHPENVRVALETVAGLRVRLRIGHGLYGVDEETLNRLCRTGTVVEFNLNSNFALNNIQDAGEAPLARYLAAGVRVVLGTDGYGIYTTSPAMEVRAAWLAGMREADLAAIRRTETEWIAEQMRLDEGLPVPFVVPPERAAVHFSADLQDQKRGERELRHAAFRKGLDGHGLAVLETEELEAYLNGRRCLSLAGSWQYAWQSTPPEDQQRLRGLLAEFLDLLDPADTVLLTGGTRFGVEGVVHELAANRGLPVVGGVVWETDVASVSVEKLAAAMVVGETLYDKAAGLYPLLREIGAPCLFFGGGTIVNDEIQAAANLRLYSLYLAEGPGASARHAQLHPQRSFRSATELFGLLQQPGQWQGPPDPYWHLGPNPTVDLVLVRGAPAGPGGEVLLIRRDADARAEPDRWALPGGFPHTEAPRGALWEPGAETLAEACLRELREETGLDLAGRERELEFLGEYEGDGRDPRDTSEAWSHSTVFLYRLPDELAGSPLVGGDDAADARWFPLCRLPRPLAFDHARILTDAIRRLTRGP